MSNFAHFVHTDQAATDDSHTSPMPALSCTRSSSANPWPNTQLPILSLTVHYRIQFLQAFRPHRLSQRATDSDIILKFLLNEPNNIILRGRICTNAHVAHTNQQDIIIRILSAPRAAYRNFPKKKSHSVGTTDLNVRRIISQAS